LTPSGNELSFDAMTTPILYIKPGCPWCEEVLDYLKRKNIEFKKVVVSGNREAMQEMIDLSGQSKAPTMDWDGEVLADFGVDELIPFLKKHGL
jgi:glutaredoxin 3